MIITYAVYKCYDCGGSTKYNEMLTTSSVDEAIKFHKSQDDTESTWYSLEVHYEESK